METSAPHNARGFTLIETIIYIALFSLLFTGVFASAFPFFTSAERLTRNVATEGETAFILAKINYALAHTITSSADSVSTPSPNRLILRDNGNEVFEFTNTVDEFCTPPLSCKMLVLETDNDPGTREPLNAQRVEITDFTAVHTPPAGGEPRYVDVQFKANGEQVGPVRYYLHF